MIARILYRENVHGVLNYVLGKTRSTVLGFQNTYSDTDTDREFFKGVLYHLGNRHGSEKRYVHISINLPRGEKLSDQKFFELSKEYMDHMGYGQQPYVVIRHQDTKHPHVHIVSTTIKEDCTQINLSNDFKRNVATQKYLEKRYGLTPSPKTKERKELPIYQTPTFKNEDVNGVRFYIQDILNNTLQKYSVRSFGELAKLVKDHHIQVRTVKKPNGRVGVSYGIEIENSYRSRFIDGYTVHRKLSGPKLQKVFERNLSSKLLPMVKKRLEKQLLTTYKLFKTIHPEHLPDILNAYQNLDCKVDYNKEGKAIDFTIYDKSGYILKSDEIANDIGILQNPELFQSGYTQMYMESDQLHLELQKCIKEAFQTTYRTSGSRILFSEHIDKVPLKEIVLAMTKSERFLFLKKYLNTDNKNLGSMIDAEFRYIKDDLYIKESIGEERGLKIRAELIKEALAQQIFEAPKQREILFELLQSLGTVYHSGTLNYSNSHRHRVQLDLGNVPWPDRTNFYTSPSFVWENEKVLDGLLNDRTEKEMKLSPAAIFLPLMFPNLYDAMKPEYQQKFEKITLKVYQKHAERIHINFEKSPDDHIKFFNAKGFYFEKKEDRIHIRSIYSKYPVSVPLAPKMQAYLVSSKDLNTILREQARILDKIKDLGQNNLKSLWSTHLIERGQYKKVAYMMALDGVRPNIPFEILRHHMENGLKETILSVSKKQIDAKQAHLLRRGIYAISNLLGSKSTKVPEVFNGFKDEMTDWSKYKGKGLSI